MMSSNVSKKNVFIVQFYVRKDVHDDINKNDILDLSQALCTFCQRGEIYYFSLTGRHIFIYVILNWFIVLVK